MPIIGFPAVNFKFADPLKSDKKSPTSRGPARIIAETGKSVPWTAFIIRDQLVWPRRPGAPRPRYRGFGRSLLHILLKDWNIRNRVGSPAGCLLSMVFKKPRAGMDFYRGFFVPNRFREKPAPGGGSRQPDRAPARIVTEPFIARRCPNG